MRYTWQRPLQQAELFFRKSIVRLTTWARTMGITIREIARLVGRTPRTLRAWIRRAAAGELDAKPLGRMPHRSSSRERNAVCQTIKDHGPTIGVAPLQAMHRAVPRREARDLLQRARKVHAKRTRRTRIEVRWKKPRTVWAIDTTETRALSGEKEVVLSVRDVTSHSSEVLCRIDAKNAKCVEAELRRCFEKRGAPFVLKRDNGSEFENELVNGLLDEYSVVPLNSPPREPRYNGACEAGIGQAKRWIGARTQWQGMSEWTSADLENARTTRNSTLRPWGAARPSPREARDACPRVTPAQRIAFREACERDLEERVRRFVADSGGVSPTRKDLQTMERRAVVAALVRHELVAFKTRRILAPVTTVKPEVIP